MKPRCAGISLASILLLTAVVAIYAAGIVSIRTMEQPPPVEAVLFMLIVGLLFGTFSGGVVGAFSGTRKLDIALGALAGALFGPPSVLLLALPDALPVILVGGVVLVAFAFAVRFFSPKDRGEAARDAEEDA